MKKIFKGLAFGLSCIMLLSVATVFVGCKDEEPKVEDNIIEIPTIENTTSDAEYSQAAQNSSMTLMNLFGSLFNFKESELEIGDSSNMSNWIQNYSMENSNSPTWESQGIESTFLYTDYGDERNGTTRYNYSKYLRLANAFYYAFANYSDLSSIYLQNIEDLFSYRISSKEPIKFNTMYHDTSTKSMSNPFMGTALSEAYYHSDYYMYASTKGSKIYFNLVENDNNTYSPQVALKDAVQITIDYDFVNKRVKTIDVFVLTFYLQNSNPKDPRVAESYGGESVRTVSAIENFKFDLINNKFRFNSYALAFANSQSYTIENPLMHHNLNKIKENYTSLLTNMLYLNNILTNLINSATRVIHLDGTILTDANNHSRYIIDNTAYYNAIQLYNIANGIYDSQTTSSMRADINNLILEIVYPDVNQLLLFDRSSPYIKRQSLSIFRQSIYYFIERVVDKKVFTIPQQIDITSLYKDAVTETMQSFDSVVYAMLNSESGSSVSNLSNIYSDYNLKYNDFIGGKANKYARLSNFIQFLFVDGDKIEDNRLNYIDAKYGFDFTQKPEFQFNKLYKESFNYDGDYLSVEGDYPYQGAQYYYYATLVNNDIYVYMMVGDEDSESGFVVYETVSAIIKYDYLLEKPKSVKITSYSLENISMPQFYKYEDLTVNLGAGSVILYSASVYELNPSVMVDNLEQQNIYEIINRFAEFNGDNRKFVYFTDTYEDSNGSINFANKDILVAEFYNFATVGLSIDEQINFNEVVGVLERYNTFDRTISNFYRSFIDGYLVGDFSLNRLAPDIVDQGLYFASLYYLEAGIETALS